MFNFLYQNIGTSSNRWKIHENENADPDPYQGRNSDPDQNGVDQQHRPVGQKLKT